MTACGGGGGSDREAGSGDGKGKGSSGTADTKVSQAVVKIAPKDGAGDVETSGALKVTAAKGKLTEVRVEDTKGNAVKGSITDGGATWTPHVAPGRGHQVHGPRGGQGLRWP